MKLAGFLSVFFVLSIAGQAQTVKGTLMDPVEGVVVKGATVQLLNPSDSSNVRSTTSDSSGTFLFTNLTRGSYVLKATSIGFETFLRSIALNDSTPSLDLDDVYIPKKTTTLEGVVIVASAPAVSQKGDTTQFSAGQYKVNPDATVEDLIKKMPGITVDRSGNVTAQGEQVRKVTVDGKDFFGDDATMALKNLPSEVVDKIQVFDRLSDQAQLTGFDDGNAVKAINIVTKSQVTNGQFGRIYAGYGTDSRYQAGGNVSFFNGDRRLSFVGNFNNVNQQNFASQDLLGVTGSGGGGGRGGGFGGGGNNFTVGMQPGISKTNAFGINFSDKWGKKKNFDLAASYFFNNSNNTNETNRLSRTEFTADSIRFTGSNSLSSSNNNNHRFNLRAEYKLDSNNTIYIIPSINFQDNNSYSSGSNYTYNQIRSAIDSVNSSISRANSNRNGYNINNNIMYRHSFAKRGRTLSLGFVTAFNKNQGESFSYNALRYYNDGEVVDSLLDQHRNSNTNGSRYSARANYSEPIGKQGQLEFEYEYEVQHNKANQETFSNDGEGNYDIFQPLQSNKFDNTITTNTAEVDYRLGRSRDNQLSFGVDFQNSKLEGNRIYPPGATPVRQQFNTLLPNFRWSKKIGLNSNFRLFYRARTDFPSIDQLQDVLDISNPLNVSSGNPLLKQAYTNFGSARYSYVNRKTGHSFFVNFFGQMTNDYITNAVYYLNADSLIQNVSVKKGSQFSKPINLNGYKQLNAFVTYSFPFKALKSNLNINGGFTYVDRPGSINNLITKTTNNTLSGGIVWASNISEYIDFNINYSANFSNARSEYPAELVARNIVRNSNNRFINQSGGAFLNLLSKSGWFLQNDVSNQTYSGLSEGFNTSYWLWNAAVGKKFLKNKAGELKLSVFDLLKQNQSVSRTIDANNTITDQQSRVLQQYFMLTFTYSLRNFGKGRAASSGNNEERREWRGGPPGGGMPGGGGRPGGGPMF